MFKSWVSRYAVYGFLLGLILPVVSTLSALARRGLPVTLANIGYIQFGEAAGIDRWLVDLSPLALAVLFGLAGHQRDRREQDVRRLHQIADIRSVLNASTSLETMLNQLAAKWAELAGARECSFATWDDRHNSVLPMHPRSPFDEAAAACAVAPDGVPLTHWVIEQNTARTVSAGAAPFPVMAVPLAVNNRAFAVALFADPVPPRELGQDDIDAAMAVADQVALTISHIRSSAETRRRARDMEAIGHVARRIAAGWDIDRILVTVAESAQVRFGMDFLGILTVDESSGEFVERAQAGPLSQPTDRTYRQKLGDGLIGRAYRSGQQVLARDVRKEPDYIDASRPDVLSELVVPLRSGRRVVGVMVFDSRYLDAFGNEDIEALQMLADQVAVAVENARLYDEAESEQQRLSAVLASTGDAVIVIDAADRVQLFNRAAERYFGVPAAQTVGARLDESPPLQALADAYRSAPESHVFELAVSESTTLLGNLTPVRHEALGLLGRVLTLHDISDLKRLDALKSQMLRMASHDLRNPLNMAFGYLDLLDDALADRTEHMGMLVDGLRLGLHRMRKLIEDLLNLERIESATEQTREPFDLNEVVQRAADELRPQADGKRHALSLQATGAPALVSADPVQLPQVIVNLISNAIKYTPDGGHIQVRVAHADRAVTVEVEDDGLGIPKAAQAKLFSRFYRVKMRGTEDIEGTGLGLSLVKTIVEQHGGRIEVESEEGRGSLFRVRLPALIGPAD